MAEGSRSLPTGPTIRSLAKKKQANQGGGQGQDREVVKAALASPLTVPWPNIPRHLQRTLLHALPQIAPREIADYHVSRQRCHRKDKRDRANAALRQAKAEAKAKQVGDVPKGTTSTEGSKESSKEAEGSRKRSASSLELPERQMKKSKSDQATQDSKSKRDPPTPPTPPEILSHLVLGINEVLKSLERQIGELRTRIMIMGDALNGQLRPKAPPARSLPITASGLLPTAPSDVDLSSPSTSTTILAREAAAIKTTTAKPLMWIFIPLASISPQALVNPIPQYCATYNTLVFQHTHLAKICRTRLPSAKLDEVIGSIPEEVRVVPMGRVEGEMAEMVGLRRLACLGVRASHPALEVLHTLLPKSVLHPPRLSLTLPLPTSSLHIYNSITTAPPPETPTAAAAVATSTSRPPAPKLSPAAAITPAPSPASAPTSASAPAPAPAPVKSSTSSFIHYAPLHVKGITTTIPADANARKAKRMEEVRVKRREAKEAKRLSKLSKKQAKKARADAQTLGFAIVT